MIVPCNPDRRIVCLAIQDEAWRFGRFYKNVLRRIHLHIRRFSYRSSFAGCGYVGRRPYWIRSMSRHQRRGPSYVNIRIPLSGGKFVFFFLINFLVFRFLLWMFYTQHFCSIRRCMFKRRFTWSLKEALEWKCVRMGIFIATAIQEL